MDGQPLTLTRNNDAWQTDTPAHTPGPATITLAGSQDGQPFTRSLNYTVDQPLTRDIRQGSTHTVSFDTNGGSPAPGPQQIDYPYGRVQRPTPDPTREGFLFDGWFTGNTAYDFSKPVTDNLTLTAHWTFKDPDNTWKINPDRGSQFGNETTTITPPDTSRGIRFSQVSGGTDYSSCFSLAVGSAGNAYAWGRNKNGQLGNGTTAEYQTTPVMVRKPDRKTYPDLPEGFTYVQVSAGQYHSLTLGSDGNAYAWGYNNAGQLGNPDAGSRSLVPVPVTFNLQLVITGVRFDQTAVSGLTHSNDNSVTVLTPIHVPGMVTVSVDYTLGGTAQQPDTSLRHTYLPAGVLPRPGREGILLALATGMTGMGGVLASRRHRRERHRLLHTSHE